MLGNGVTPAAGAAEPLWQAELPNLARNINFTQKWEKAEIHPIYSKITHKCTANRYYMPLSRAKIFVEIALISSSVRAT